jgi:hypothetical protein
LLGIFFLFVSMRFNVSYSSRPTKWIELVVAVICLHRIRGHHSLKRPNDPHLPRPLTIRCSKNFNFLNPFQLDHSELITSLLQGIEWRFLVKWIGASFVGFIPLRRPAQIIHRWRISYKSSGEHPHQVIRTSKCPVFHLQ